MEGWMEGWMTEWVVRWMIVHKSGKKRERGENFHSTNWGKKQKFSSGFDVDSKIGNLKVFIKISVKSNRMCICQ
jgi:hypothetical protein